MIECVQYKPYKKEGSHLIGFADLRIGKWGGVAKDFKVFQKDGRRWVTFASETFKNDEGVVCYCPWFTFDDKAHMQLFSEEAKKAIDLFLAK